MQQVRVRVAVQLKPSDMANCPAGLHKLSLADAGHNALDTELIS